MHRTRDIGNIAATLHLDVVLNCLFHLPPTSFECLIKCTTISKAVSPYHSVALKSVATKSSMNTFSSWIKDYICIL